MTEKLKTYISNMRRVVPFCLANSEGLYVGIEGHRRLARECGYAMNDFSEAEQKEFMQSSYSVIYVAGCGLRPLLDAKEWIELIKSQIK